MSLKRVEKGPIFRHVPYFTTMPSTFSATTPYNALANLPPAAELDAKPILKACIEARSALANLNGRLKTIPNANILVDSITLQEARASSEIENILTTNDALFKAYALESKNVDPATKEVLHYRQALTHGKTTLQNGRPLSTNLFIELVQIIKANNAGVRKQAGTTIKNSRTGKVIYSPPQGEQLIREKLKHLEHFIHAKTGNDPLVDLALSHYQFEAIHPFYDGNGRTGRIINVLFLLEKKLLEDPIIYLSRYIIENKPEYYRLLQNVTEKQEWQPWCLFIIEAVRNTAIRATNQIDAIRDSMYRWKQKGKSELPTNVYSRELFELVFKLPYTKIQHAVDLKLGHRQTVTKYLNALEKLGLLSSEMSGREKLYINRDLWEILENS